VKDELSIRRLTASDAGSLSAMLLAQPQGYLQYFNPFSFDRTSLLGRLEAARLDDYMGFFLGGALAGFFMLRGWDEGYEVPAYGVAIDSRYRGLGLGASSIELAKVICRLRGAHKLMLKVHPENVVAKNAYEAAGFHAAGTDSRTHHLVYHLEFKDK